MPAPASERAARFSLLRLLARFTAGMGQLAAISLALLVMVFSVPLVGSLADWMVKHRGGNRSGVRPFLWVDLDAPPPSCSATACGMATLPLQRGKQVGGADSVMVTARMLWPAPVLIEASPGTHLEVVGVSDALHPVVQRPNDAAPADEPANDAGPVLLANEVQRDGRSRPIVVTSEGFVSAWAQESEGNGESAEQLTAWAQPAEPERNKVAQEASIRSRDARKAAIERSRQWRAMKMRKVQFQPVPALVEVDVLRAALLEPVPVGYVMAFEWQIGGVLSGGSQLVPSHSGVGVVTRVQTMGQYERIQVHIPRTSPYGRGHWLWHRLDGVPPGVPVLPNDVRAVFFKPGEMPGATPDWWQLERVFLKLPKVEVMRAPAAALDSGCAEPVKPAYSCVWVMLQGVAVPVQVSVQAQPGGEVSLTERPVFAGKALRPGDWAALPRTFRSAYGSPSTQASLPSRTLLDTATTALLLPQPWLKAGLPVSVAASATGRTP